MVTLGARGEPIHRIASGSADYPSSLHMRLGPSAPKELLILGNLELLRHRRTALFCSVRTPGDVILRAFDVARLLRDQGFTVISGFHSQMEKECLRILLRGTQPIIICPARAIDALRISSGIRSAFDAGRVLFLSPFNGHPKRVTQESALQRNEIVAALADYVYIAHISPEGATARIAERLQEWNVPSVEVSL